MKRIALMFLGVTVVVGVVACPGTDAKRSDSDRSTGAAGNNTAGEAGSGNATADGGRGGAGGSLGGSPGNGGDGGAGDGGSGASGGSGGAGGCQSVPTPMGGFGPNCFGSGSVGSGTTFCEFGCYDAGNNSYSYYCTTGSCECKYNNQTYCTCSGGCSATNCCPPPWTLLFDGTGGGGGSGTSTGTTSTGN